MGKKLPLGKSQAILTGSSAKICNQTNGEKLNENDLTAKRKIIEVMEKENGPVTVRRSSRNKPLNGTSTKQEEVTGLKQLPNAEFKASKTVKSSLMNPSKKKTGKSLKLKSDALCQSKITLKVVSKSEAEVLDSQSKQEIDVTKGYEYLITDEAPATYWKELAELRQSALEATLHENESLRDKLVDLQAENEKLETAAKSSESLAYFVSKNLYEDQPQSTDKNSES